MAGGLEPGNEGREIGYKFKKTVNFDSQLGTENGALPGWSGLHAAELQRHLGEVVRPRWHGVLGERPWHDLARERECDLPVLIATREATPSVEGVLNINASPFGGSVFQNSQCVKTADLIFWIHFCGLLKTRSRDMHCEPLEISRASSSEV